jgi:hypothetical protein
VRGAVSRTPHAAPAAAVTAALALALAGCAGEQTGIIVEVDTTLAVPQEVDSFRIEVTGAKSPPLVETFDLRGGAGDAGAPARRPARLGLRPADPDRPPTVMVVALGLRSGGDGQAPVTVVRTWARLSFHRGEVRTVALSLSPACKEVECRVDEICNSAGRCVPVAPPGSGGLDARAAGEGGQGDAGAGGEAGTTGDGAPPLGGPMGPPADGPGARDQSTGSPGADGPGVGADAGGPPPVDAAAPAADSRPPADPPPKQDAPVMADAAPPPPRRALGEACQAGAECQSGACAEGLCCDRPCTERCHSCRAAETGGANGRCAPASAGRDPGNHCAAQPPASCGPDGACDGRGGCRNHGPEVECAPAGCADNSHQPARRCTGGGACAAAAAQSCGRYVCAAGGCPSGCQSHDQCTSNAYCNGSGCDERKGLGEPCRSDRECNAAVGLGCLLGLCTL